MSRVMAMLLFTFVAVNVAGDELYEYGKLSELKGVAEYFVDTGSDLDLRNLIAEQLASANVKVVERPGEADHWIIFRWSGSGQPFWTRTIIIKRVESRQRLLFTYRGTEQDLDDLATDAGKAIAKRLKEMNSGR